MNPTNPIHSSMGIGIWAWHVLWGVTIVLLVAAVLAAAARHRPAVRHGLWLGALLVALSLPVGIGLVDGLGWSVVSMRIDLPGGLFGALQPGQGTGAGFYSRANLAEPGTDETVIRFGKARGGSGIVPNATDEHRVSRPVSTAGRHSTVGPTSAEARVAWSLVLLAWGMGSMFLAFRWAVGGWQLKRLLRDLQAPPPGWHRAELENVREALSLSELPPICLCVRARMPMVAGLRYPRVILPQALATQMSSDEFRETLIHECAHIQRRDQWVLVLQRVALLVFWPHLLFHYLNRELERAREELCDNHVLTFSRPTAYAETLLRLAQFCLPAPKWGSSMAMLGGGTPLEERIRRLLEKRRERKVALNRCSRLGLALLMTLLAVGISGIQMHLTAAPDPAKPRLGLNSSVTVNQGTDQPGRQIEQKVIELTRDWGRLRLFEDVETWAAQIHELAQIGPPAVPALTALLDRTEADLPLRLLGFTLRAIGDPRAVPALIRSIPRTLRPAGSDCGVQLSEGELKQFMLEHHLSGPKEHGYIDLGRPVREISAALQRTTGTSLGEEEAYNTFLDGDGHQRDLQRQVYDRIAHRWADWWGTNWDRFVADPALVSVALPPLTLSGKAGPGGFPTGPTVKLSGGYSNLGISPVEKRGGSCFLDLDTGRRPAWPKTIGDSDSVSREHQDALWVWAAQEGIDLAAVTYRAPGADKDYYGLKGVGLQAWEVPNERWDTAAEEVTQDIPLELGRPVEELLMHYDSEQGRFIPNRRATFLFITREGTPGILRLVAQVLPPGERLAQGDPSVRKNPIAAFRKRYGLPAPTIDLNSNQEEEEAGLEPIGVKIEYRFFVRGSGG